MFCIKFQRDVIEEYSMRILLTGGRGLVGRNIINHELSKNYELLAPTREQLDLENYAAVKEFIRHELPDMIIHAAGKVGGIQANMKSPVAFLTENLDIGRNIVMAAKEAGIKRLINLGSSCMYPRNGPTPLPEEQLLGGKLEPTNEGYALAKITITKLCQYIEMEDSQFQYKTLIPCNIYGKYDRFDPDYSHMLPSVIRKIHEAKKAGLNSIEVWGDGNARREFMYAGDLADCIWKGVSNFATMPSLMNIGIGRDYTINEYYEATAKVIGFTGTFTHDLTRPVGMKQKLIDSRRCTNWGWKAKTTLEDGIAKTYDFFLKEYVK